jgi:hypothetical protein
MKIGTTNIESTGVPRAPSAGDNFSRVKMWVSGFASADPGSKRNGRTVPRVFVNTRKVMGSLTIAPSTYAVV